MGGRYKNEQSNEDERGVKVVRDGPKHHGYCKHPVQLGLTQVLQPSTIKVRTVGHRNESSRHFRMSRYRTKV